MAGADLERIYREALRQCTPETLVARVLPPDAPRTVVAIGKAAGAMLDGVAGFDAALVAIPEGYRLPQRSHRTEVVVGSHPLLRASSFRAGEALLKFVSSRRDILFLISGGGSACAEVPLRPHFAEAELALANETLLRSGLPIGKINCVRKHLSAIKGGRLGKATPGRRLTVIYSDVASGALSDVASGPTLNDQSTREEAAVIVEQLALGGLAGQIAAAPETVRDLDGEVILAADNNALTTAAAGIAQREGLEVSRWDGQIECDVQAAAEALATKAKQLRRGEVMIAGGEVTVRVAGAGRGGRCSELAVRFAGAARAAGLHDISALFASSDGLDGSSGVAGFYISRMVPLPAETEEALARSDSLSIAKTIGRAIIIPPEGNNLRDLYLLARS